MILWLKNNNKKNWSRKSRDNLVSLRVIINFKIILVLFTSYLQKEICWSSSFWRVHSYLWRHVFANDTVNVRSRGLINFFMPISSAAPSNCSLVPHYTPAQSASVFRAAGVLGDRIMKIKAHLHLRKLRCGSLHAGTPWHSQGLVHNKGQVQNTLWQAWTTMCGTNNCDRASASFLLLMMPQSSSGVAVLPKLHFGCPLDDSTSCVDSPSLSNKAAAAQQLTPHKGWWLDQVRTDSWTFGRVRRVYTSLLVKTNNHIT